MPIQRCASHVVEIQLMKINNHKRFSGSQALGSVWDEMLSLELIGTVSNLVKPPWIEKVVSTS